jgi:hypothetical protein
MRNGVGRRHLVRVLWALGVFCVVQLHIVIERLAICRRLGKHHGIVERDHVRGDGCSRVERHDDEDNPNHDGG